MKRVFICAHANFPMGNAAANYIEYLALALMEEGHEVYVFATGENRGQDRCVDKECYCYNGIFYYNILEECNTMLTLVKRYLVEGKYIIDLLDKFKACEGDVVISYTTHYFCIRQIYEYAKKRSIKTSMCITEWFQPFQYKGGVLNPIYWLEEFGFRHGIPMSKSVLPISRNLERHFQKKGCKTLCLPVLANPPQKLERNDKDKKVLNFIYAGNAIKKDAIDMIVLSFAELNEEELKKIHLHFVGMSEKTILYLRRSCGEAFTRIEPFLTIHSWMEYDELIKLYHQMDFLILLRKKNKVTISNFPSKVPEMMGYGIIPIVSQVGDYTEDYLTDKNDCIIVKECEKNMAAKAVRDAIQMTVYERIAMRQRAYQTVIEKFAYQLWSKKIEDFLFEK